MLDNPNRSIHELYDVACKIDDFVSLWPHLDFTEAPMATSLPLVAIFLGELDALWIEFD